jgi:nickel-dependent lactate racemase
LGIPFTKLNTVFTLKPAPFPEIADPHAAVLQAIRMPLGSPPLRILINKGMKVLVIADDLSRPTPLRLLIPPLLEELNISGIPDRDIQILIALGTHRKMRTLEMQRHFGEDVYRRVSIVNHEYDDPSFFEMAGKTADGIKILVNRRVLEADFVVGVSSIVPHAQVGWGGGAKIVLPGVAGAGTVSKMHLLAAGQPDYPFFAGRLENPVRQLIEEVARKAGLRFIVNSIFNGQYKLSQVVAGDPMTAHRAGVKIAERIFIRPVPKLVDIVIVDARPADMDFWQGLKAETLAAMAVKPGGVIIIMGRFPDGISPTHDELARFGRQNKEQIDSILESGTVHDGAVAGALYQHAAVRGRATLLCVSDGISRIQAEGLGMEKVSTLGEAIEVGLKAKGREAEIGFIEEGGEVVPCLTDPGRGTSG